MTIFKTEKDTFRSIVHPLEAYSYVPSVKPETPPISITDPRFFTYSNDMSNEEKNQKSQRRGRFIVTFVDNL